MQSAGFPNFGDELVTAAWLRWLASNHPEKTVWLDVPHPGNAAVLFDGMHPRLRLTDTLWQMAALAADHPEPSHTIREWVHNFGTPRFDLGIQMLRGVRSIHFLGGGYLNDIWPHQRLMIDAAHEIHTLSGADLFATGQGLMPSTDNVQHQFHEFGHVSARDEPSTHLARARLYPDDAFLYFAEPGVLQKETRADLQVFLCIQRDLATEQSFSQMVEDVRRLVLSWGVPRSRIYYVEGIPGVDYEAYSRLADIVGSSQKAVEPRAASERPGSVALRRVGLVVGALGLAG